jgi:hypothetical protein
MRTTMGVHWHCHPASRPGSFCQHQHAGPSRARMRKEGPSGTRRSSAYRVRGKDSKQRWIS